MTEPCAQMTQCKVVMCVLGANKFVEGIKMKIPSFTYPHFIANLTFFGSKLKTIFERRLVTIQHWPSLTLTQNHFSQKIFCVPQISVNYLNDDTIICLFLEYFLKTKFGTYNNQYMKPHKYGN